MTQAIALLVSHDARLVDAVAGISATASVRLEVVHTDDQALAWVYGSDLAILIVHVAKGETADAAGRLKRAIDSARKPLPMVVLCDEERPQLFLSLLQLGVVDCLPRPLDLNRLTYYVENATLRFKFASPKKPEPAAAPKQQVFQVGTEQDFLYDEESMGTFIDQVRTVAPQDINILITGETGTGKTRLAKLIHELSNRRKEPFMVVNCGTLSANLIESELFGHIRGAFTGADRDRAGKFADCGKGTLLLDDIDTLPTASQVKLLRAVEERLFEPVGSNRSLPVQARLIAATNRPLKEDAESGKFRLDLYYRLQGVSFHMQPLRERPGLLKQLAEKFVRECATRNGREVEGLSPGACQALVRYTWPGNIRELRNVLEGAVALCPARQIRAEDLPRHIVDDHTVSAFDASASSISIMRNKKEESELEALTKALETCSNNLSQVARHLGISRPTLYKRLRRYGLFGGNPPEE